MSTKTTFKRIALVAVAALGLGVLSVAPSSAGGRLDNLTTLTGVVTSVATGETASATTVASFIPTTTGGVDTLTVTASFVGTPNGTNPEMRFAVVDSSTGALPVASAQGATPSVTLYAPGTAAISATLQLNLITTSSTTAGTYRVVVYTDLNGVTTEVAAPQYISFTVTAADTKATGASTSTLQEGTSNVNTENIDSTVVASKSITAAQAANIKVVQKNSTSTANESFTAVVSGPGYITSGASASGTRPTSGAGITVKAGDYVHVWSTGTAGTATITMTSISGVVLGTETVKFYGDVTKIAQTQSVPLKIGRAGGYATAEAFTISATDALGIARPGLTITGTSSNVNVVGSVTVAADATTPGDYLVSYTTSASSKSGDKATITFKTVDPAVTTSVAYLSTTADVTIGGAVAKEVITLDKASYSPGEQMIITITATDASGNPVYDGKATPALTSNKSINGLAVAGTYSGGKADSQTRDAGVVINAYTAYAPATGGEFVIKATSGNATADVISVTATVADAGLDAATDAANEATDAANAATDAALAAADAADAATAAAQDASDAVAALSASVSKLISSLRAQITSLTNLVIKIQKKVRA